MNTETVFTKDLKKGDLVNYHGAVLRVKEDAVNYGQRNPRTEKFEIKNDDRDIWAADCQYISGTEDLRSYQTFQSNSLSKCWARIL